MAPSELEAFSTNTRKWVNVGKIRPTDPPGSLSNNKPNGSREMVLFGCSSDDSKTTIWRSKVGIDVEVGKTGVIRSEPEEQIIKELNRGESFEMEIKIDQGAVGKVRFTHK